MLKELKIFLGAIIVTLGFCNYATAHERSIANSLSSNAKLSLGLQYAQTNNATINIPGASRKTKKKNRGRCVQAEIKKIYAQGTPSEVTWYELSHHHPRIRGKRHGDKHRSWRTGGCH
tara:strand:- start:152 stop:505 length:354 start_codon:yes stop_codon:yes gene_type:complete